MAWLEIAVSITSESREAAANILIETGCQGIAEDSGRPGILIGYIENSPEFNDIYSQLSRRLNALEEFGLPAPSSIKKTEVQEADWANEWKKYFKPVEIGRRLVIKPGWEDYHGDREKILLTIDPGQAFGTGGHQTTRLCLCALEDYVNPGNNVADIGTGSGILSIAAARLGASCVYATDIDFHPRKIAKENARLNGLDNVIHVLEMDDFDRTARDCHLVVANIISDTIIELIPSMKRRLKPEGILIVSGIVAERLEDVLLAITSAGMNLLEVREEELWRAVIARAAD
jgi:ribosomal protein L11 methyltransferase